MIREEVDEKDHSDLYYALEELKWTLIECLRGRSFIEKLVIKRICGKPILFKAYLENNI